LVNKRVSAFLQNTVKNSTSQSAEILDKYRLLEIKVRQNNFCLLILLPFKKLGI
jgi:hypothetical protein